MQAVIQNCMFFHTPLLFPVELGIKGYYDPGQLPHAVSQDTDLSCHDQFPLFVALCAHNSPMDRRADIMYLV